MRKTFLVVLALVLLALSALAGTIQNGASVTQGSAGFTWQTARGSQIIQYNILTFGGQLAVGQPDSCKGLTRCYSYTNQTLRVNVLGYACPKGCSFVGTIVDSGDLEQTTEILPDGSSAMRVFGKFLGTFVDPRGGVHTNVLALFNTVTNPATDGVQVVSGGTVVVVLSDN